MTPSILETQAEDEVRDAEGEEVEEEPGLDTKREDREMETEGVATQEEEGDTGEEEEAAAVVVAVAGKMLVEIGGYKLELRACSGFR